MNAFFRFFERLARPFDPVPAGSIPREGLAFILHFARQRRGPFIAMLVLGGLFAFVEAVLFMFVGIVVDAMAESGPAGFFADNWAMLLAMALAIGLVRPLIYIASAVLEEQIIVPDFFTRVRWQSHLAVSRQDISFFDDEMAGRVSQKVWQSGQAAGDFMVSLLQIIWFIAVFAATTLVVIAGLDWRMAVAVALWLAVTALIARHFVPRIRDQGRALAEATSVVTGRMVDGYSNIRTVKLHAAETANDRFIRAGWDNALSVLRRFTRVIAGMRMTYQTLSSLLLVVIAACSLWLFSAQALSAGEVAIVLALCLRLNLLMGRLLGLLNGLFRNFGTVQNSAQLISRQPEITDRPAAIDMTPSKGPIVFDQVGFSYPNGLQVFDGLSLTIAAGEKVGIVGPSGGGKSTLMNMLLRFYDLSDGAISIGGQNISVASQASLRAQIGFVSQDTSLLHRSIFDNIAYGRPEADRDAVEQAARRANAHNFIMELKDERGRTGYDCLVGERGVKLSGGQRQRIAIARVFLRDAPILLLDEATSALDSNVEAAIQDNLAALMQDKTVIAIAHRLSTIAHLERLIVTDEGRIIEEGSHAELLAAGGLYADLWNRQSGGFLGRT